MKIMLFAAGGDIGGGKTHILSLAKELSASNDLKLVSFRSGVLADEGRDMGLDVVVLENGWNIFKDMRLALAQVDAFNPDVIHCHGAKANMLGVLVKKLRSISVRNDDGSLRPAAGLYGHAVKAVHLRIDQCHSPQKYGFLHGCCRENGEQSDREGI